MAPDVVHRIGEIGNILKIKDFKEEAITEMGIIYDQYTKSSKDTMRVYYYKKDYWALLSKSPKRGLGTIYLKEGVRDELLSNISNFYDDKTREIYLNFGIPYKCVNLRLSLLYASHFQK